MMVGCSKTESDIQVPSFYTIGEYQEWASQHQVQLQLIDIEGNQVDVTESASIISVQREVISSGDTLELIVSRQGEQITIQPIMESN